MKILFTLLYIINLICIVSIIVRGKHSIYASLFWVVILLFIPLFGSILYYLFGSVPKFPKHIINYKNNKSISNLNISGFSTETQKFINYNISNGKRLTDNNNIKYYFETEVFYNKILDSIKSAKKKHKTFLLYIK